ncbi:XTP/dITP diphosphatase [Alkalihalobacillus sp. LMS39]|uniref:XTP/dITP diphosphatase n=1 Tax=Alkalihalobacillus sp. LMS39 TaxID=2924032 RepID=UPI001FB5079B|nr:XTP/dITP diphosphatase [Alkalihalobacillus sp. LMS39]UOE93360.1 XTP/dITP diphosphatase [Alkalihalobacillus sp. LMS39]
MKELIIATKNKGKLKEFESMLAPLGFSVTSLLDYPEIPDVEETGLTFAENASIKAMTMARYFQKPVIADDSGLCVDALSGQPGVHSARYAGVEKDDTKNNEKLIHELKHVKEEARTARFHCALVLAYPDGKEEVFEGTCEGVITTEPKGSNGFGYDPLLLIPSKGKTMAELTMEEKNEISHRKKALQQLQERLKHWMN